MSNIIIQNILVNIEYNLFNFEVTYQCCKFGFQELNTTMKF
jgi:hypothetical protein